MQKTKLPIIQEHVDRVCPEISVELDFLDDCVAKVRRLVENDEHQGKDDKGLIVIDREFLSYMSIDECLGILYHEIGHYKCNHTSNLLGTMFGGRYLGVSYVSGIGILLFYMGIFVSGIFVIDNGLYGFILGLFLVCPIILANLLVLFIQHTITFRKEREADIYAVDAGYGEGLLQFYFNINTRALEKQHKFEFSNCFTGYPHYSDKMEWIFQRMREKTKVLLIN